MLNEMLVILYFLLMIVGVISTGVIILYVVMRVYDLIQEFMQKYFPQVYYYDYDYDEDEEA